MESDPHEKDRLAICAVVEAFILHDVLETSSTQISWDIVVRPIEALVSVPKEGIRLIWLNPTNSVDSGWNQGRSSVSV